MEFSATSKDNAIMEFSATSKNNAVEIINKVPALKKILALSIGHNANLMFWVEHREPIGQRWTICIDMLLRV